MPFKLRGMWLGFRKRAVAYSVGVLFFLLWSSGLGVVPLFDWDEVNFAECAREMRQTGEYLYAQIGFLPFWEKPPLFFWVQALSMSIWGENAFAARFPNAVISLFTLLTLYEVGRRWHGHAFGLAWLFLHGVSLLPSFYARSGLIDPLFNLFMLWALLAGTAALSAASFWYGVLYGLFAGLATLTKGPVGLLLPSLAILTLSLWQKRLSALLQLALGGALPYIGLVGGWIILLYLQGTGNLLKEFWAYQWRLFSTPDAGHKGPWYYHLVVLSVGMFPAAWWAFGARRLNALPIGGWALLMLTGWTILIFSIVQTKILHYSSLAYYGISYLGAWTWMERRGWVQKHGWLAVGVGSLLLGIVTVGVGFLMAQPTLWLHLVRDPFARAALQAKPLTWTGWEGWMGFLLLVGIGGAFVLRLGAWKRLILVGASLIGWETLALLSFAPRAEAYTQAPLRVFCEEKAAEKAPVWSLGFKSYIPYFYGRMAPEFSPRLTGGMESFQSLLLSGAVPFPVYFVSRVERYQGFVEKYGLEVIGREGGYVFLRGNPMRLEARGGKRE